MSKIEKRMIKNKIVNHLTLNGNKRTSEKVLTKCVKEIQKESKKSSKKIIQLAIVNVTPIFKVNKISNKKRKKKKTKIKEIPSFISSSNPRVSFSIKLILLYLRKKKAKASMIIKNEIIQSLKNEGTSIQAKDELQKKALLNKRYLSYYRW